MNLRKMSRFSVNPFSLHKRPISVPCLVLGFGLLAYIDRHIFKEQDEANSVVFLFFAEAK